MQDQFLIISDSYKPAELQEMLQAEIAKEAALNLEMQKEAEGTRSLNPEVLAALFSSGGALLGTVITVVVNAFIKALDKKKEKENTMIIIKAKNGAQLQFPAGSTPEEIQSYLEVAKQLEQLEYIAVETE